MSGQSGISVNSMVNEVNVVVIGNSQCQRSYGSSYVRPNVLCTDGIGGVGICGGDSGGPLVLRNRYGQQILVKIYMFQVLLLDKLNYFNSVCCSNKLNYLINIYTSLSFCLCSQVGISSFAASNACERGHPSGFVRVTSHYNFITQHL